MAYYFISDLHFGHENMLAFDSREFRTIEEHDEALINNWNNAVGADDEVFILGDLSWHGPTKTIEIFKMLNGIKHLIVGNHDKALLKNREFQSLFVEITDYKEIVLPNAEHLMELMETMSSSTTSTKFLFAKANRPACGIVLCHYPIPCFNKHYYGWIHLYGHVHNSFEWNMMKRVKYEMEELYDKPCRMYNVGAMIGYMDYTPRTLEEILSFNEG